MALLLRVVTNPKWKKPDWMEADEIPADALTDLRSVNNKLSVWSVEPDQSDLDSALIAVASSREHLDKLDYALFDEQVLPALAIEYVKSEGDSPYLAAKSTKHRDLIRLTVRKVARLAEEMMPLERVRVSEKEIKLKLLEALRGGMLDRARIKQKLLADLEPPRS
jgi:hypothetical protein